MRYLTAAVLGAALALFAVRAWAAITHQPGSYYFSDVSSFSPHNQDIGYLVEYGVTSGTTETTYSPSMSVTREQMASFLMRQSAVDSLITLLVQDLAYHNGYLYGDQAYQEGRITYDEYQDFQAMAQWWYEMCEYETTAMGSAPMAEAARIAAGARRERKAR